MKSEPARDSIVIDEIGKTITDLIRRVSLCESPGGTVDVLLRLKDMVNRLKGNHAC